MNIQSALFAVLALATTAASATVIDFEAVPSGLLTSYTTSGVTFTPVGGGFLFGTITPNGTNGLLGASNPHQVLRADIAGGTSSVSVDLGDFDADPDLLFLQVFDAANNLLDSTSFLIAASFTGMMTLSVSHANIAYAIFGATLPAVNGSSVFADNFTFGGAGGGTVPEPASLALVGLALAALVAARRRQR